MNGRRSVRKWSWPNFMYYSNICFDGLRKTMIMPVMIDGRRLWNREFPNTKLCSTKFHGNPLRDSRILTFRETGRHGEANVRIFANFLCESFTTKENTGALNQYRNKCQFHHLRDRLDSFSFLLPRSLFESFALLPQEIGIKTCEVDSQVTRTS